MRRPTNGRKGKEANAVPSEGKVIAVYFSLLNKLTLVFERILKVDQLNKGMQ